MNAPLKKLNELTGMVFDGRRMLEKKAFARYDGIGL